MDRKVIANPGLSTWNFTLSISFSTFPISTYGIDYSLLN